MNRHIVFVLALLLCLGVDVLISVPPLEWPGATRLLVQATSGYAIVSTSLLVSLVLVMYVLFARAASRVYEVLERTQSLRSLNEEAWVAPAKALRAALTTTEYVAADSDLFRNLAQRHQVLTDALRYVGEATIPWEILRRLEPADLVSASRLHEALERNLRITLQRLLDRAEQLEYLGMMAATTGLAGTVLGLIAGAGGAHSSDAQTTLLFGLQAALIKTFVGYTTKAMCQFGAERVHEGARHARAEAHWAMRNVFQPYDAALGGQPSTPPPRPPDHPDWHQHRQPSNTPSLQPEVRP